MKNKHFFHIVFLLFALFIVLPVIYTFFTAFFAGDLLQNLQLIKNNSFKLILKSGFVAFCVALLSTVFGSILAFLLYKTEIPLKKFFKTVLLIPLFLSPYILAVAWKDFFYLFFNRIDFINSYYGVIIVLSSIFSPFSMLIIGSALSNIDAQLEENALLITGLPKVVLKITLPLIKPALISSFVLVFIFGISEFSVPAYFGVKLYTTEIFTQFSAFYNHSLAILQSFLLVFISILMLLSEKKYIKDAAFLSIGTKGNKAIRYHTPKIRIFGLIFSGLWFLFTVILPFTILFVQSFKNGSNQFIKAVDLLLPTFSDSFGLAFSGAIFTLIFGFTFAYYSVNHPKSKLNNAFNWFVIAIFAIPSIIFGISLIKFYNRPALDAIYSSSAIIILAYVGKFTFIVQKLIENALRQIPKSLDEAALIQGVKTHNRIIKILLPLLMPSLFSAFIISFIFNFGELGTVIMLYPPGMEIMPVKVYTLMANAPQSLSSSMSLLVFLLNLLLIGSFYFIYQKIRIKAIDSA